MDNTEELTSIIAGGLTLGNYKPSSIPINLGSNTSYQQIFGLIEYLRYKVSLSEVLDIPEDELTMLKQALLRLESYTEGNYDDSAKKMDELLEDINTLNRIKDSRSILKDIASNLENLDKDLLLLYKVIDDEQSKIELLSKELIEEKDRNKCKELANTIISDSNNLAQELIRPIYTKIVLVCIPVSYLHSRVQLSDSVAQTAYKNFICALDELLFYQFLMLNCRGNFLEDGIFIAQGILDNDGDSSRDIENASVFAANMVSNKGVYDKAVDKLSSQLHVSVLKLFSELVNQVEHIATIHNKIEKLIYIGKIATENYDKLARDNFYNGIFSYLVAPSEIVSIATTLFSSEMSIPNNDEVIETLAYLSNADYIRGLSIMLLVDIVRFHQPNATLDSSGIFITQGFLGMNRRYFSRSEIYEFIERYKLNPNGYSMHKWKVELMNILDEDIFTYNMREEELKTT